MSNNPVTITTGSRENLFMGADYTLDGRRTRTVSSSWSDGGGVRTDTILRPLDFEAGVLFWPPNAGPYPISVLLRSRFCYHFTLRLSDVLKIPPCQPLNRKIAKNCLEEEM